MVAKSVFSMWGIFYYYLLVGLSCYCFCAFANRHERSSLVYPSGGALKLIFVLVVPVKPLDTGRVINLVTNFQFVYTLPTNISEFSDADHLLRRRRRSTGVVIDRGVAYGALELALDRQGVNGSACVLRTICEVAATPLHHDGLLGEILHLIFTPRSREIPELNSYSTAWQNGKDQKDCYMCYPLCDHGHGIMEYISSLVPYL